MKVACTLCMWLLATSPAWATTLTVDLTVEPGAQGPKEIVVMGLGTKDFDAPSALRTTLDPTVTSYRFLGDAINTAFPGTDYVCFTGRKVGDAWFPYRCKAWPVKLGPVTPPIEPPPVIVPPIMTSFDALKALIVEALDSCIAKKQSLATLACTKTLRDALKKETK